MNHRPFEVFCEMIDGLAAEAVVKAAATEQRLLNEDLASGRTVPSEDTSFIRSFCRYLEGAAHGRLILPRAMPIGHWLFYGRTVERLVEAGELPLKAKEDLEAANSGACFRIMA